MTTIRLFGYVALFSIVASQAYAQSQRIDSLKNISVVTDNDSIRVLAMVQLAYHYTFNDPPTAANYIRKADSVAARNHFRYGSVLLSNMKGIYFDVTGSYDSALFYFSTGLAQSEKYNYPDLQVKMLNGLGMNHWNRGKNHEALDFFLKVLSVNESLPSEKRIHAGIPHNNIGLIYQELGQYDKALDHHDKSLAFRKQDKLLNQVATSYNNIGICLAHQGKYAEAERAYREGILIAKKEDFRRQYYDLIANLANTLVSLRRYREALAYNMEIVNNAESANLPKKFVMNIYGAIAGNYLELNEAEAALSYANKGLAILETHPEYKFFSSDVYKNASIASYILGRNSQGKYFAGQMAEVLEKKFSSANAEKVAELEVKYETAVKNNEIQRLRNEKDEASLKASLAEAESARQRQTLYLMIGLIFMLACAGGVWFYFRQMTSRVREEQKWNAALFMGEQNERIRIARDIHDSIGQKLSAQKMMLGKVMNGIGAPFIDDLRRNSALLDETIGELRNISHNLMPQELTLGLLKAIENTTCQIDGPGLIDVSMTVDGVVDESKISVSQQVSIYRILQEIINNMIRHSAANTISVHVKQVDNAINFSVADDGKGFNVNKIADSEGIGWKNMKARAKMISAALHIASEENVGTRILLTVPYNGQS